MPPSLTHLLLMCLNLVPRTLGHCRLLQSSAQTTSQATPAKVNEGASSSGTALASQKADEEEDTPKSTPTKEGKKKSKKGNKTSTRSSPRTQLSKRTGGPPQSSLAKLEEALAKGETVDVNISNDSDDVDRPNEEKVSDDEVSPKTYFYLANA